MIPNRTDLAALYALGKLTDDEAFEQHFLECDPCRTAVREALEISAGLALTARRRRRLAGGGAAALASAAVIGWLLLAPPALVRLGAVERAPVLNALPVRGDADAAAAAVERGIQAYEHGDYRTARTAFKEAVRHHDDAGSRFFLGASQLMSGRADSAAANFALAANHPGYAQEAHYYSAKARLRLRQDARALAALRAAAAGPDPTWIRRAQALADSVRAAQ